MSLATAPAVGIETPPTPRGSADPDSMSADILAMLSIYEGAGIAARDRVDDAPGESHPRNLMPDFRSVIVLARVPRDVPRPAGVGAFHHAVGTIAAQDAVTSYLRARGFKHAIVGSRTKQVSLPRLGERAGVGQLSPVGTLAVRGHGLSTVLSAILTDAPLRSSPPATDSCPNAQVCLRRCAALSEDGTFDRSKCTSCGACVKKCARG